MLARIIAVLLFVIGLLSASACIRGGRLTEVYRTSAKIIDLQADARGLCWLEGPKDGHADSVCALDGGKPHVRRLIQQPGLTCLAISQQVVAAIWRDGQTGALIVIPRAGGSHTTMAPGLQQPAGLVIVGSEAFWTEIRPTTTPAARHIPATEPRLLLRAVQLNGGGPPRTVACLRGGAELTGELLGGHDGRIYLIDITAQDCGPGWSNLRSVPISGGIVETPLRERDRQTGRLVGSSLYWTAPSDDAGNPTYARSLRHAKLPVRRWETITDWLPSGGRLLDLDGRIYYASMQGIWVTPDEPGLPGAVTQDVVAGNMAVGFAGALYQVRAEGPTQVLYRKPCAIVERIKAGFGIP